MIPNIFISSTIIDLAYLRDGLREAVLELAYNPVMSEHGEVGYLNPETAAESCYRSVKQCQMAVVIVGRRYGKPTKEGNISVTHKEFRTARDSGIPVIAFVENQVMAYKDVFACAKDEFDWNKFEKMDNASMTFSFLDEIRQSQAFNGLISFTSVAEAKKALKLQIANFVGESLSQVFTPMKSDIKSVLAEVITMREEMRAQQKTNPVFITAIRYIVDENRAKGFKYLIEHIVGPPDKAVQLILESKTFDEFVAKAGAKMEVKEQFDIRPTMIASPNDFFGAMSFGVPSMTNPLGTEQAHFAIRRNNVIEMNSAAHNHFDWTYHGLKMEIGIKSEPEKTQ